VTGCAIHTVDIAAQAPDLAVLTAEELDRGAGFVAESARRQFLVARSALRHILAAELACDPRSLRIAQGEHGKPYLPDHRSLAFNVSHCASHAIIAVADAEVGIDIETTRVLEDLDGLIDQTLTDAEREAVGDGSLSARSLAFLRLWTAKEAVLKALGVGLSQPLRAIEVVSSIPALSGVPMDACLHGLDAPSGTVASLAVKGRPCRIGEPRAWSFIAR
jgi:4'-phosphopantetheinyl transferase